MKNTELKTEKKTLEAIIAPPAPHYVGNAFHVHNFIPGGPLMDMKRMSPFIVLDYNAKMQVEPSDEPHGVGVHPHKGFETVTIVYHGSVSHRDSSGGGGTIHEGEVQWMTAAGGILHKEYYAEDFNKNGGDFQVVQLWVNLPAKDKQSPPKYQAITADNIKVHELDNKEGIVKIIAGEYNGVKGTASTFTDVNVLNAELKKGGEARFNFPAHFNTALLLIEGSVELDGEEIPQDYFALMNNDGEEFSIKAREDSVVLVLSGEPINEPIAAHGPFVMNTREELAQAFHEYNTGKFGYLE